VNKIIENIGKVLNVKVGFSTALVEDTPTFIVKVWVWKFCVEFRINAFWDENRDGKPDKRRR